MEKTNSYTEELFVKYLKKECGDAAITFVEVVGTYASSPDTIIREGQDVTKAYAHIKWFNF